MHDQTQPTEALEDAIIHLLLATPARWTPFDPDSLTSVEGHASSLLTKAGLIELRSQLRARMEGDPAELTATLEITGHYTRSALQRSVLQHAPHWQTDDGRTAGRIDMWIRPTHVRLTPAGEGARRDYEKQPDLHRRLTCAFVTRTGLAEGRANVKPQIHVVDGRLLETGGEMGSADESTQRGQSGATDDSWLIVTEAAQLLVEDVSGLDLKKAKAKVSRAASRREFRTNGQTYSRRRIERGSFTIWLRKQQKKDLDEWE